MRMAIIRSTEENLSFMLQSDYGDVSLVLGTLIVRIARNPYDVIHEKSKSDYGQLLWHNEGTILALTVQKARGRKKMLT